MAVDNTHPVHINGAGIAGLTSALALANSGYRVVVYEKAEGFETIGAGLQLSPNALRVLYDLGLAEKLHAVCTEPLFINIANGKSGKRLTQIPLGHAIRNKHQAPYLVIHRADLHHILFSACKNHPDITLHFSSSIVEMAPHQRGVTVATREDGENNEHLGIAALVADGVWSRLRTDIMNLTPPRYTGKIAWRGMFSADQIENSDMLENTHVWFGPKSHVVTYPVRSGRSLNLVAITPGPETNEGQTLEEGAGFLDTHFRNWRADFLPLISMNTRWTGWPLFEIPKISPMHVGSIALVGDAAHAMLPFAAQGAAMAIEDAAVIASCMQSHDTPHEAMAAYSALRKPRVKRVMKTARTNGDIYHMSGLEALFRDIGMRLMPASRLSARQDWIYSWRVDKA